ncbi:hypothetical protein ACMDCR_15275 [Labrys okinawensis]|uniref:hypothetical protein n=1 Tax=Labrys okinawensis TaxID=346911 RepID=UPI0039BD46E0
MRSALKLKPERCGSSEISCLHLQLAAPHVDDALIAIEARALAEHLKMPLADATNAIGVKLGFHLAPLA